MSVHEVTYYQAKCDGCGFIEDDYGDFSAWMHSDSALEMLGDDWETGIGPERKDFCPNCRKCEVCGEAGYRVEDHLVCEDHEDHEFVEAAQ